ncbi:uncharacterized protein METZ01_LOCUS431010, partial [marine metagenome]
MIPIALALLGGHGCTIDSSAILLEIVGTPIPTTECVLSPESKEMRYQGTFDPIGGAKMQLGVLLQNNLNDREVDSAELDGGGNLVPSANAITIQGFNVCYHQVAADISEFEG